MAPPTLASAPGTACAASRTWVTVLYAAWLSGGTDSVPCSSTRPSRTCGGPTDEIPLALASAARSGTAAEALPITWTGWPDPAGKCAASTCSPATALGVPR